MHIDLIRYYRKGETIDGILRVDGQKQCDTSENATTALPAGQYIIVRHFCKQYNRFVPLITERQASSVKTKPLETSEATETLKPFETGCSECEKLHCVSNNTNMPIFCPQLKMGNGIHNRTDGSIILGTRIVPGCLKLPREPYENLSERIRKISGRGNEITLTISENYPQPLNHFSI